VNASIRTKCAHSLPISKEADLLRSDVDVNYGEVDELRLLCALPHQPEESRALCGKTMVHFAVFVHHR